MYYYLKKVLENSELPMQTMTNIYLYTIKLDWSTEVI